MNINNIQTVIKTILDLDETNDNLIQIYVNNAINLVKGFCNYTNDEDLPIELEPVIVELVLIAYSKRGSEGKQSENIGVMSSTYLTDIPPHLKQVLYRFRKVRVW